MHFRMIVIAGAFVGLFVSTAMSAPATGQDAFVHPGGLYTQADIDRMKAKVAAKEEPWIDGWNLMIADRRAQNGYRPNPKENMGVSRQRAQDDAMAAYLNALRWQVSGDTSYADCAVRDLNSWSAAVKKIPSGADQPGLGGIPIGSFAMAAELLRSYPGWHAADQERFKNMLLTYFYPACNDFLLHHRDAKPSTYWANWDAANVLSLLAIGVYCDDRKVFDEGIEYYKKGIGMGSIEHAVPFVYPGGLGQWQESGRDHAHAFGGMGLLVEACQIAWNQGVDLFGFDNDRILAGATYEAQYAQWIGVPYTFYTNAQQANQYYISAAYRGRLSNCEFYELLYNHYSIVKGYDVSEIKSFAQLLRPEGGNVDLVGYGTLTYTIDAAKSTIQLSVPPTPQDLVATSRVGKIALSWSPSGGYTTRGYAVSRATSSDGPYDSIYSTSNNTTPALTDDKVEAGTTYYYKVAALNQAGRSPDSAPVSSAPAAAGDLPNGWSTVDMGKFTAAGKTQYSDASGGTFIVQGGGEGIGGAADGCHFAYQSVTGDFTITARLTGRAGSVQRVGLMIRQSIDPNAPAAIFTLGDVGGREARFSSRASVGENMKVKRGNDYTWTPVWFRLQRIGNALTGSQSPDGATWYSVGTVDIAMTDTYLVGLTATSGKTTGALATATFDNVSISATPPEKPPTPSELAATAQEGAIMLAWQPLTKAAGGLRVESSVDGKLFYEIADLPLDSSRFVNTNVMGQRYYRIRAYNTGGFSDYSSVVGLAAFPAPSTRTAEPMTVPK